MTAPRVDGEIPSAWVATDLAQPPLTAGSGAHFTQWEPFRSPDGAVMLTRACVLTPIPGWVSDMRTAVEARGNGLAMATAERMTGAPAERRDGSGRSTLHTMGAPESAPPIGVVDTFLGFDDHEVATCFAVCTTTKPGPGNHTACESSVGLARLRGGTDPPAPGLVVGTASWAVHHPVRTAAGGALAAVVVGVLAVLVRRRPRSRI